jgi:hypothetical protein
MGFNQRFLKGVSRSNVMEARQWPGMQSRNVGKRDKRYSEHRLDRDLIEKAYLS